MTELRCGTSGFSYEEWKGSFYPPDLPDKEMLGYYAERLPVVEINASFYRLPKREVIEAWARQVPESFRFVLKAPRRITHLKRLKDVEEPLFYFHRNSTHLGEKLACVLFQLAPSFKKNEKRLGAFLDALPDGWPVSFEFRHASWLDDDVFEMLRRKNAAVCLADADDGDPPELAPTATWGYLRLRRESYDDADLDAWAERIARTGWKHAWVFFKHEREAPELALRLAGRQR